MTAATSNDAPDIDPDNPQQPSPAAFAKARATRPEICGSYAPERPYPIYLRGVVERGFGRGGKDLGCPTANLPSKVIQTHPSLQRTGIYYGFARVLPQDPDDPDLAEEDEHTAADAGTAGYGDARGQQQGFDDVDVQTDEDGDEVVLSASPVNEEAEIDLLGGGGHATALKRRQMSRSSVRSSRSVKSVLEKADQLTLERTASSSSTVTSNNASPISPTTQGQTEPQATALQAESQGQSATAADSASPARPVISTEKHPRHTSTTSSQASSLRHKKKIRVPITAKDARVYPMVMSVGWNPFYKNTFKTGEVHIMHDFKSDFYGLEMRVVVLGYIRPEYNYVSKEALIQDIDMDKKVAINSLARSPYQDYVTDPFLMAPS